MAVKDEIWVAQCHGIIDSWQGSGYPFDGINTYDMIYKMIAVPVDDAALLASEGMGGPIVSMAPQSKWGSGRATHYLGVATFIIEEMQGVLDLLGAMLTDGRLELPKYRTQWRLRGGELFPDIISAAYASTSSWP